MARPTHRHPRAHRRPLWAGVLLAALSLGGIALAGDVRRDLDRSGVAVDTTRTPSLPAAPRTGRKLVPTRQQLVSRVGSQLESLSAFGQVEAPGGGLDDHAFFGQLTDDVRRGVTRATRRSVRDYLLEATEIDATLDRWKAKSRARTHRTAVAEPAGTRRASRTDFGLDFHGLRPEVEMSYESQRARLKLSLDFEGAFSLRYHDARMSRNAIQAGFDGDDLFHVNWSIGF